MEGFWRRFRFYLTGFIIGCVFVYFLLGSRSCNWFPSDRVKSLILSKSIVFPEGQIDSLTLLGINSETIENYIKKGTVSFSQSLKKGGEYPKVYVFEKEDSIPNRLQFSVFEDSYISVVHILQDNQEATQYTKLEGWGDIVYLPRDSSLLFIDQSNHMQCKARGLASSDYKDIVNDIKATGRINFSKSDLMLTKAEQQLYFVQQDSIQVEAKTIWFKDRITFKDFIWEYKLPCED